MRYTIRMSGHLYLLMMVWEVLQALWPARLEDRPDHHEEIQTPTHLDILTF
jgi:hypothetical protein